MKHQSNSVLGLLGFCYLVTVMFTQINGQGYEETCKWWEDSIIDSLWIRIATAWLQQAWSISYQFKFISHRWQQRLWDFQPIITIIGSSLLNTNWISRMHTTIAHHIIYIMLLIAPHYLHLLSFFFLSVVFGLFVDFSDRNSFYKMLNFSSLNSLDILNYVTNMHPQINALWICYWLGVCSAYIRQVYADESLKQMSAPPERGKQINK